MRTFQRIAYFRRRCLYLLHVRTTISFSIAAQSCGAALDFGFMVGDAPDSWVHLPGRFFMYPVMVQSRVLLTLAATWAVAAAAETDFPYAVGVDRSGRASGQSDGDGRVMIESPEYPRGLWLHLLDEAGRPLPGLHVEYQAGGTAWCQFALPTLAEMCRRRWCGPVLGETPCA